jgi:hypothetical protein
MASRDETISRYEAASAADDFATMGKLRHSDWEMVLPQSGEMMRGHDNYVGMRKNRPEGAPRVEPLRHGGAGDTWWSEAIVHYADGSRWLAIFVYEFEGDLIRRERAYFGQPFPAPAWRSKWVERVPPAVG